MSFEIVALIVFGGFAVVLGLSFLYMVITAIAALWMDFRKRSLTR